MRMFDVEVCGGTCVFGFMIEKNACSQCCRPAVQELRDPRTLARVVDHEVAGAVVERENGPVAAVRQPAHVISGV